MRRRDFLKTGLYGAAAMTAGTGLLTPNTGFAQNATIPRTLVNMMLAGGVDLRFAIVPVPSHDATYVNAFWNARKAMYRRDSLGNAITFPDYASMFADQYQEITDATSGFKFGIHKSCGWLIQQYIAGKVAIVANVFGSLNRDHDHSVLIVNTGDPTVSSIDKDRDGWGGRLVEAANGETNVVEINNNVSIFTNGSNASHRQARVIHGKDMRNMALLDVNPAYSVTDSRNVTRRALFAYYAARGIEIGTNKPADWVYRKFFQHYDSIQAFGGAIRDRLATHPIPAELAKGTLDLVNNSFEQQCRNLYDCCQTPDILGLKVISMFYGGFDSHADEQSSLTSKFQDIFGTGGGLNIVTNNLTADIPGANEKLVYLFTSDFGRQLAANGTWGTDHGSGSYTLLVGDDVTGGLYGEMFPQREALPEPGDGQNRSPFEIPGQDIKGLTSFERLFAAACDWAAPGTGPLAFPNAASSEIESGVSLANLLAV